MLRSMFTRAAEEKCYRCCFAMLSIINPYDSKSLLCRWKEHVLSVKQNVKVSLCLYTWQNHSILCASNLTVKIIGLMFSTGMAGCLREVLMFKQEWTKIIHSVQLLCVFYEHKKFTYWPYLQRLGPYIYV